MLFATMLSVPYELATTQSNTGRKALSQQLSNTYLCTSLALIARSMVNDGEKQRYWRAWRTAKHRQLGRGRNQSLANLSSATNPVRLPVPHFHDEVVGVAHITIRHIYELLTRGLHS